MRSRLALMALALLLAAPVALGQSGAPPPEVTVDPSVETLVVSRDQSSAMSVAVTYTSQNPFDDPDTGMTRQVELTHSSLPAGWAVEYTGSSVARASDGQTVTFNVRVTLGTEARQSQAPVTFTARVSDVGLGTTPLGPVLDPAATGEAQVTLQRQDPLTRQVLEGLGGWIWLVLGGVAILAVVLAVVLARSNRPVVALTTAVREARVAPGRSVAVPIVVQNLTGMEDNVVFHVAALRAGWTASLPVPDLPLDGRRREELHLVITAPPDAAPGESVQVGLTAHAAQNPRRPADLVVPVQVAEPDPPQAAGDAGSGPGKARK